MPIKTYKPTSPGRRFTALLVNKELSKKRPEKSLTVPLKQKAGRSRGKISVRGRGSGHKRIYRIIDFKRHDKIGTCAEVIAVEYDPNRSANIALVLYEDGEKRYVLAWQGAKVGDKIETGPKVKIRDGNALPLESIPGGSQIYNLELHKGQGARMVRSAGQSAKVMAKEGGMVQVKLPSGEIRLFHQECYATLGQVSNVEHAQVVLGKAGRKRNLGRRPHVRGVAMPAGEHPHGGGEGRTGTGRPPKTPWGKKAHGVRTRKKNKKSNKYIVKTRREK